MVLASWVLLLSTPAVPYRWRNVEIVGGGFVTGVIAHPRARDVVYARTDIGGAYRWEAKAGRWVPLQDWLTRPDWNLYGVESVALDPGDANRVYIAAGTYTNAWGGNGAILRSRDRGRTWLRTDLPFKNGGNEDGRSIGERLAVDPNDGRVIYFGTRLNGLMRSQDYGATWEQVSTFPIKGRTNRIGTGWVIFDGRSGRRGAPTRTIYAGLAIPGTMIFRSEDAGASWRPVPGQPGDFLSHQAKLTPNGMLYVAYSNAAGPNGVGDGAVWRMDTKTGVWTDITPEKPGGENTFGYGGITFDAKHPDTVMASTLCRWKNGDTVFRSRDRGKTWISLKDSAERDSAKAPYLNWGRPEPEFGHWIGDVEIDPHNPDRAWYVTGATIWGTDNLRAADKGEKTRWVPRAEGLEETAVIDLSSPTSGAPLISGLGDIGGFRHDDLAVSPRSGIWTNPILSNTDDLDFAGLKPEMYLRVGRGNGAQHGAISVDGAKNWTPLATDPPGSRGSGSAAISADGGAIVWISQGAGPHVTTDRGATWRVCAGAPRMGRVVSDRVDPKRFTIHREGRVWMSADGGVTFTAGASGLPPEAGKIVPVVGKAGHLWLPTSSGVYRSKDGGTTFEKLLSVDLAEQIGLGAAAPGADYPALYIIGKVGGTGGVFRSIDEGRSWARINDAATGFGTMQVIEGDPKMFGRVYVGTNGRGILVADPR